ncbi:hypothetical protein [Paenibacillus sp. YN15]|uniref:hypothetical protein n=1 Tax=Paenibacillus sp. YN15 TaxID=1742774 RepID=UPI000DCEE23C|nr:hypothetical protein [Paenibacillus sp. YN15]RAV02021.1 hypothetical protein DQG13_10890 [Paenibacillus sp. YN15]
MASFEFEVSGSDDEAYDDEPAIGLGKMILIFIFLLPLFPIFLLYRFIKHRNQSHNLIKDVFLSGAVLLILFALSGVVVYSTGEPFLSAPSLVILFVFLLPGIALIWKGKRLENQLNERYVKYRDYIYDGTHSVPKLAELAGRRIEAAKNDLKHMVCIGLIDNGFVDDRSNRIVFGGKQRSFGNNLQIEVSVDGEIQLEINSTTIISGSPPFHSAKTAEEKAAKPEPEPKPKPKTVQCHGCGASLTFMEGETKRCEYCDSIVS